jgi:outer membrane immunogenic protein
MSNLNDLGLSMKKLLVAGVTAAALCSASAFAADLPERPVYKAPVVQPAFSWTGFYVGVNGGYGWGSGKWSNLQAPAGNNPGQFVDEKMTGGFAGIQWGYNYQVGSWVFGYTSDLDWANVKGGQTCFGTLDHFATCATKTDGISTSTVRVGYAFGQVLPYVKGGWALAHENFMVPFVSGGQAPYLTTKEYRSGWTGGAGIEFAFDTKWSVFAEYDYLNFGSNQEGFTPSVPTGITTVFTAKVAQTMSQAKFGVNYRY